jgi:hypothetical protein
MRFVLLLLAVSAAAAPAERSFPEFEARGVHASHGICGGKPYCTTIEVPSFTIPGGHGIPDYYQRSAADATHAARTRMMAAWSLTARIHHDLEIIVQATNECPDAIWKRLDEATEAGIDGAKEAGTAELRPWLPKGDVLVWTPIRADSPGKNPPALPSGRYDGACQVPPLDDVLYVPEGPGLSTAARAKLAVVAADADAVVAALRDQKEAAQALVRANGAFRCRETLKAFDALVDAERGLFYDYREKAVAGAVWNDLTWKKTAP